MSDKEKLMELLTRELRAGAYFNRPRIAGFADYLIANGVVIQKQGEWIFGRNHGDFVEATCTSCDGMLLVKWYDKIDKYRHCPNCGAKMKEVE